VLGVLVNEKYSTINCTLILKSDFDWIGVYQTMVYPTYALASLITLVDAGEWGDVVLQPLLCAMLSCQDRPKLNAPG